MSPPVRVVCRGCLRSVELASDVTAPQSGSCPFCSQPLDSRLAMDGPTHEPDDLMAASDDGGPVTRRSSSTWVATWSRGSLGMLGRFQLRERLGDGGFGEVYLAYDPRLDRDVALKVLRQSNPSDRVMERFFREARAAARLDHPNIVSVYDSGFDRGRCWVAYQKVSGKPLWWFFDHQPITPVEAARLLRDLAEAVDYAHKHGVVHRDIKPANILIDDRGRPRLIDFGLARRADLDSSLTSDGAVVGTPAYMSPEQAQGYSRQVDERSDVFSLGVVLFETLAGHRPESLSTVRTLANGQEGPETSPSAEDWAEVSPAVPAGLVAICKKATAERPDHRYPSARALADDLDAWLREQAREVAPPPAPRRMLSTIATTLVLVAASLLVGYFAAVQMQKQPKEAPKDAPLALAQLSGEPGDAGLVGDPSTDAESGESASKLERSSQADEGSQDLFVANRGSKLFHSATCPRSHRVSPANRVGFESSEDATAAGFEPCEYLQRSGVGSKSTPRL
ncbi:serine/threonine-protein kinase [Paludisphaera rhizosphaerae]|uniref:serine/threonine-protein kinase n=1 Tax=Paludisphaera rhizosphaerae TaxID=2711216 RepID=UPI0013EAD124|nr:serine/threonine-protein kinase [Paludisphaera rhizosphaerae]